MNLVMEINLRVNLEISFFFRRKTWSYIAFSLVPKNIWVPNH